MQSPLVSIILPVYNGEKYLRSAIDSILAQTYTNFELIVIDDASTDGTKDIIKSYTDKRILYLPNKQNSGVAISLNNGINAAKGVYTARMDADDIALPERIEKQVAYLESHPNVAVIDCIQAYIDEKGKSLGRINNDIVAPYAILKNLPYTNCIGHPSVLARSHIFKKYLYRKIVYEDYDLWLRVANDGNVIHKLNEPLLYYRIHDGSITGAGLKNKKHFYKLGKTLLFYFRRLPVQEKAKNYNLKVFGSAINAFALWMWKTIKLRFNH